MYWLEQLQISYFLIIFDILLIIKENTKFTYDNIFRTSEGASALFSLAVGYSKMIS